MSSEVGILLQLAYKEQRLSQNVDAFFPYSAVAESCLWPMGAV